jgi:hypothetical protein
VGGHPFHKTMKIQVKFGDKESEERTTDLDGDIEAQWNGMVRKAGVGDSLEKSQRETH